MTSLTQALEKIDSEKIVVAVRKTLLLSMDELLVVTSKEFLYDETSRAVLHRCLERYTVYQPAKDGEGTPRIHRNDTLEENLQR